MERRLAAILAADVVGYSRLTESDEEGTLARLKALRGEFLDPTIAQQRGRIVKLMGDGALVEFASVVDAVRCAVEIQRGMLARNAKLPESHRIELRIGINLGDVVVDDDDIYGDGVNVAARLEGLADPGGICISGTAFDHVKSKLDVRFESLGAQHVKNMSEPVRTYRVRLDRRAAGEKVEVEAATRRKTTIATAGAAALVALALILVWWRPWAPDVAPASVERMAFALPEKPSIAVLPFDNLSDDRQQDYFADGLTDDLITDLSKISGLFVIARNSTFAYKGRPERVQVVAEELGVRYVVEGSVRRAGDEVRINAQLIDALSGHHVWAERYDGSLTDVFEVQDRVIGQIVSALAVSLTGSETALTGQLDTAVPEAYDAFLQGLESYHRFTPESHKAAIGHFERAIELDPDYARAYAGLAAVYWAAIDIGWDVAMGLNMPWQRIFDRVKTNLARALERPSPLAYRVSAQLLLHHKRFDEAVAEIDQGIALDPNNADSYISKAEILVRSGKAEEAEAAVRTAMRLNPHYRASYLLALGHSLFAQKRFEEAAEVLERAATRDSDSYLGEDFYLAAAYGHLGRTDAAKAAVDKYNKRSKQLGWEALTLGFVGRWTTFKEKGDMDLLREGLRKAGVPEGATPLAEEEGFLALVREDPAGFEVEGATKIDSATAKALFDRGVTFVDVRSAGAYGEGHVPGSVHLDLYVALSPESLAGLVAKDDEVVFYCFGESCYRSAHACAKALTWGFTRVFYFAGGFPAWKEAGYPVEAR